VTTDARARLAAALSAGGAASSDFDLNPGVRPKPGRPLRDAAVLVGVLAGASGHEVILTKRSSRLKHHPGQIAFPGGKADEGDGGPAGTALREAREEVGLPGEHVEILGALPVHETVTAFRVTPVVGWIDRPFDPLPEAGEVAEVFRVPLSHVTDPGRFSVQWRHWQGHERRYYTVPWGPYYIWGATARILRGLAERLSG